MTTETVGNQQIVKTKRRITATPWENKEEFATVYKWLYAEDSTIALKEKALQQLYVWQLRRSSLCPAAVLGTMVLLEIHLKDQKNPEIPETDMCIFYASAFTRFFNYMSSVMQTHFGKTMYQAAEDLGLKDFVVDLRHTCSHGTVMPPLSMLRSSTSYCLCWLHDYYWHTQMKEMLDVDASNIRRRLDVNFDQSVYQYFSIFDAALEAFMGNANTLAEAKSRISHRRLLCLKNYCHKHQIASLQNVFEHVAGSLLSMATSHTSNVKYINQTYVEGVMQMQYFFSLKSFGESKTDLVKLIDSTQPLFRMLVNCHVLGDLFAVLLDTIENPYTTEDRRANLAFWAYKIAQGFTIVYAIKCSYKKLLKQRRIERDDNFPITNITQISDKVRELLACRGIVRRNHLIFCDTITRPWLWVFDREFLRKRFRFINLYTAPLIKSLLPIIVPRLSDKSKKLLMNLMECYFNPKCETDQDDRLQSRKRKASHNDHIYTYNDYLRLKRQKPNHFKANRGTKAKAKVKVKANGKTKEKFIDSIAKTLLKLRKAEQQTTANELETETQQYGIWSITSDDRHPGWKSCPLGCLPWLQ